jgi:hypothetical protein
MFLERPHGDWNLGPSRQIETRGDSLSLVRLPLLMHRIQLKPGSMSGLA